MLYIEEAPTLEGNIAELYVAGLSKNEVQEWLGVSRAVVDRALRESQVEVRPRAEAVKLALARGRGNLKGAPGPRLNKNYQLSLIPTELGYLAAIIDGEGSIGRNPGGVNSYNLAVDNTSYQLVKWLHSKLNCGKVSLQPQDKRYKTKPLFRWRVSQIKPVFEILSAVEGLLIIKGKKAQEVTTKLREVIDGT